ncbi:hypothetical protein [Paenacidovorax monticola]|uniref:DUF2486 family protein n=1 Tax=Paenacidovorax monticola TaxID=1926868 RepID=A0A7H0HHR4_9BURK|nr:hypothetical protein [Paenacidovorax monticola]QNP60080.1 hypothetical protein H9L24_03945 [Paenacidovorax monticola]
MSVPPKTPPRFVPTLTDVVHDGGAPVVRTTLASAMQKAGVVPPPPPPAASQPARRLPDDIEEQLIHRVMQRVDVVLDLRLREAIATVVQEQTRSIVPRLREEVESVVRDAVYEAVAQELSGSDAKGA